MADTESILQLGIEAARAGDKEEARNLFRLLTRETPEDPQAWLWLAGVAEDREEKRAALEQVTNLDPSNELAKQGLAALGGPSKSPKAAPPPPPAPAAAPADDFNFDWNQPAETEASSFAMADPEPTPAPAASATPARTRELTPDEEFAMSLDSFGSLSNTYNERSKSGGDALDFNIPDFGDDDDLDLSAYMNRERVDMSTIEVTAEEAKKPVRKQISKGGISDDAKARYKEKKPKVAGARASGGWLPLLLMLLCGLAVVSLAYFIFRDKGGPVAGDVTATAGAVAGGGLATSVPGTTGPEVTLPTLAPGATVDPNAGGVTQGQPTAVPGGETPTEAVPPPINTGAGGSPDANLAALGGVQPQILPADGSTPVTVDNWFFNFGGVTTIADGNAIGVQPQGRWLLVGVLMFDGTLEGRTIPGDLMVLKDAQGRVYRANPDASEAYLNTYPGSFNINLKQPAPVNFNFSVPLLFDVSPDATDLVLFSPQATDVGYAVRPNAD